MALLQALANQVCEKVESKQRTTYNEVADELVSEFGNVEGTGQNQILLICASLPVKLSCLSFPAMCLQMTDTNQDQHIFVLGGDCMAPAVYQLCF